LKLSITATDWTVAVLLYLVAEATSTEGTHTQKHMPKLQGRTPQFHTKNPESSHEKMEVNKFDR
jgi:hypothetical protein